jgi:hypothetical protein
VRSFYYGQESTCNYATGRSNTGILTSPKIVGLTASTTLSFSYWRQVESYTPGSYDQTTVQVSYNGGSTWSTIWTEDSRVASENSWKLASVNLAPTSGSIMVRFVFNTVDSLSNNFKGWLIDDVKVVNN